jgi:hypothetical protein
VEARVRKGKVMRRRFLFEDISMLVVEGKERPEIWEREVLRMVMCGPKEKKPELRGPGKERAWRAGRVERESCDTEVRAGTERLWRAGRANRSRYFARERRGKSRVVRAGRYWMWKTPLVHSRRGKESIVTFSVGGGPLK